MFNKIKLKFNEILSKNYKVKGFLSLEVIFVISVLGFFLQKITSMVYIYIKKFYIFNSVLIIVNSYIQIPIPINKTIDEIQIINENNTLKVTHKNKKEIKDIYEYLKKNINNKELMELKENEIIITQINEE
jgi:hypothetical protein